MKEENPTPSPDAPAPSDRGKRFWTALINFGNILAAQAVPLVIGLASFIIAVDAWWSAKAVEWENDRALASLRIRSHYVEVAPDQRSAVTTMRIKNVGSLSFAMLDMVLTLRTDGTLTALWDQNSLIQPNALLPLGMKPLERDASSDPKAATYHFNDATKTWHIIDPGREVEMTFVQPTHGAGNLLMDVQLYTQALSLADTAEAINVHQTIRGVDRMLTPESGEGEVSDSIIYPYSGSHLLLIPPAGAHPATSTDTHRPR